LITKAHIEKIAIAKFNNFPKTLSQATPPQAFISDITKQVSAHLLLCAPTSGAAISDKPPPLDNCNNCGGIVDLPKSKTLGNKVNRDGKWWHW